MNRVCTWSLAALVAVLLTAAAVSVRAEEGAAAGGGDVVYQKHTVLSFDDDTIEGDLSKPDGQYLESRKKMHHQRLIKVRQHFRTEILQSVRGL